MPELPEVETTRRRLLPHVVGRRIRDVVVRNGALRWPVPRELPRRLRGERVEAIRRRGKYLLFDCAHGHLLVHLGMSGRLTLVAADAPARTHDHVDLKLEGDKVLRLTDPRRFGAMLWLPQPAEGHVLLSGLGLEPLERAFTGSALHKAAKGRRLAVKQFLMDGRVVTGVGNIYASEALFRAGVHPVRGVDRIARASWDRIARAVKETLNHALEEGGTTLRDFASPDGRAGGYQHKRMVYGRDGEACSVCGRRIRCLRQGQRSTFYCPGCQK